MSTTPFTRQLAHKYNLKKLWESKVMHISGTCMTLCHLHVTITNVQASTQGRGGEGGALVVRKRYMSTEGRFVL